MSSGNKTTIQSFKHKWSVYLFVPGNAELETLILDSPQILIDGNEYTSGDSLSEISLDERHSITFNRKKLDFYIMQGSQIPSIFITTATGSMNEVYNDKNHKEPVAVTIFDKGGKIDYFDNKAYIKGRGNTTWDWTWTDQKPFSLIFNEETSVLGLSKADRIALIANQADVTNIRNKSVLNIAKRLEPKWSPSSEFAELYVDGEYLGIYLACDKIENSDSKVVLNTNNDYLLQATARGDEKETSVFTESGQCFFVKSGNMSDLSLASITETLNKIEDGLNSNIVPDQLDMESFARKYFIEQIACNTDINSLYFYYKDGRLYSGPVWDYDLAANRSCAEAVYSLRRFSWYDGVFENSAVRDYLITAYSDKYKDIAYDYIDEVIKLENEIYKSNRMNAMRWVSMYHYTDIDAEYQKLNDIYLRHAEYLDKAFIDNSGGNILRVLFEGEDLDYLYFADEKGNIDFPEDSVIFDFDTWINASDGSNFNPDSRLTQNVSIYKGN